jgi:uncharacterized membrane protein YidH (DUF202 family)
LGTGDNESLATATIISDPGKSWAIYAELHEGGEAQYYRFEASENQTILIMLHKSTSLEDETFLPSFALMGPNITSQGTAPDYLEIPQDAGVMVVEGVQPAQAVYEPFSPGTLYRLAETELPAPSTGTYYVAVFEPSRGGHYNLAIGYREEYSLTEWILIPINLLAVYQWEGQSLFTILSPLVLTLAIGAGLIVWRRRTTANPRTLFAWLAAFIGLLFIGTCMNTLYQMILSLQQSSLVPEAAVTIIFITIPLILGIFTIRLSLKKAEVSARARIYLAILGIIALFTWTGLLVGPALALITCLLPKRLGSFSPQ